MSTALPLPLDTLEHDEAAHLHAGEAEALRSVVTERLLQHRRRRGGLGARPTAAAQNALPGMEPNTGAGWNRPGETRAKPNRVADSVAARFAKSQSYRDFLQEQAASAMREAEAARRNAEAVAEAHRQLAEEMRSWQLRQDAAARGAASAVADTAPKKPKVEASAGAAVAAETPRAAVAQAASAPVPELGVAGIRFEGSMEARGAARDTAAAEQVKPAAAAPPRVALELDEPTEPTTPIPANLIEFPRQLVAARKARPRLAEGPLREDADREPERAQLRIFEVEASSFSTTPDTDVPSALPEWSSIRLESASVPHETTQREAQLSMTLPIYAAPLGRRIMAAAVDGCCVGTAFLLAVAAAAVAGDALPSGLFAAASAAITLLLFAVGYLLLSFSLGEQTAGMRYARIALCTFGDDNPTRSAMRRRLFSYGLSAVSLGLGFLWALLDDEKLGWHDRISRMYQRAY